MMQGQRGRSRGAITRAAMARGQAHWWLAAMVLAGAAILSTAALGQDNPPSPPGVIPPPAAQNANPNTPGTAAPSSPGTGTNSTGVIRPPAHVDPGIKADAAGAASRAAHAGDPAARHFGRQLLGAAEVAAQNGGKVWAVTVSNRRPSRCKRDALPLS